MSHLQSIERACHLANPKLLELSFWCEVVTTCAWRFKGKYCWKAYVDWPNLWSIIDVWQEFLLATLHELEVIWHPITLQDILLVLSSKITIDGLWFFYTHTKQIKWWLAEICVGKNWTIVQYDLTKSPYEQEESVLEFISKNI